MKRVALALLVLAVAGCGRRSSSAPRAVDPTERGGRAYDRWTVDPGVRAGVTLPTAPGHRLKDLYGWDLRGAEGLYGPGFAAKSTVVARNWLTSTETAAEIAALLGRGADGGPPLATYLTDDALLAIGQFIVSVRDGVLARPDWIWELDAQAPGHYRLLPTADVARGHALLANRCAECHGEDGTELRFDDGAYTLGSHARQKAYEDWFMILNGQPDSEMGRQVIGDGRAMAQEILDVLAALCDRGRYPVADAKAGDVADGDLRCGAYLR